MNVTAMGKAGLTGAKGVLGHRVAPAIADATSLSEEQALALKELDQLQKNIE